MLRDLEKDDERVLECLRSVRKEAGETLADKITSGDLPSLENWYWNKEENDPCYIEENEVYCFSHLIIGEFFYLVQWRNLRRKKKRPTLGEWGKARLKYLNEESYGTAISMFCRGELLESCKEIKEEAEEREYRMIRERMKPFEALKNTNLIQYNRIWNNEMQGVREIIREELIYS